MYCVCYKICGRTVCELDNNFIADTSDLCEQRSGSLSCPPICSGVLNIAAQLFIVIHTATAASWSMLGGLKVKSCIWCKRRMREEVSDFFTQGNQRPKKLILLKRLFSKTCQSIKHQRKIRTERWHCDIRSLKPAHHWSSYSSSISSNTECRTLTSKELIIFESKHTLI